ncbi:alpha/beta hydrolase [Phytohabitans kaempferiae]|uniref:Alpha/beta hydrolase n=1 Tax=Phytohabitans kaempferiae TaxID=1620943 RepID=A0ABV6LXZ8_9ACTN
MYDQEVANLLRLLDEGFPPVERMDPLEARAAVAARVQPVANLEDVRAARDVLAGGVPVRVYEPHGVDRADPAVTIVFAHGGGFVLCDVDSHDSFCRSMARGTGATVVSVDYRRAPEHRAPAAAEDTYAALVWAAGTLGGRLVVVGDSAGGNVAAVAASLARDRGGPTLSGQVLLYPVIDPDCASATYASHGTGYYLTAEAMRWYWRQYLGDGLPEPAHLVAPLRAPTLAGLPPAVVVLGRLDPLHGEGVAYARALGAAGVPVVLREYPDMFHGFATIGPFTAGASARAVLWSDVRDLTREVAGGC